MNISQTISVAWYTCDKNCCEDYANVDFYGTPSQALELAKEIAAKHPTTFRIEIFQYDEE
jgi:hypothetical protein